MFVTLMVWVWLVKNDHWHPEQARNDAYGFGIACAGVIETVIWLSIILLIAMGFGII